MCHQVADGQVGRALGAWRRRSARELRRWPHSQRRDARAGGCPIFPGRSCRCRPACRRRLGEAALTTAKATVRFALHHVQLGGKDGAIIATDGKQLLIQTGFPFPWRDSVLVPRLRLDGLPGLRLDAPVTLGRSASHVVVQFADWTFFLRIDDKARYPQVAEILPRQSASTARWHLAAEDVGRLTEVLPNLPGHDIDQTPVTVDLGKVVTVRGRGTSSGPAVEVMLSGSTTTGTPLRFATDRHYLLRALQLGFTELAVARPDAPVVCRDVTRTYGWMVLEKTAVSNT